MFAIESEFFEGAEEMKLSTNNCQATSLDAEHHSEKDLLTKDTYWIVRGLLLSGMNETARGVHRAGRNSEWISIPCWTFIGTFISHPNNLTRQ